ncbi:MAG: hypothetical protein K2N79_00200 [Muribaculaceae bacterium]|nr:hypothetical protein [Muribaculaceae bacterium]
MAEIGEYTISKLASGSIETFQVSANPKGALREVAEAKGFEYDPNWTTQQFGNKLVTFLLSKD